MTRKEQLIFNWNNIIEELYEQETDFNYVSVKRIVKNIQRYEKIIIKERTSVQNTLQLTEFNESDNVKEELEDLLNFLIEQEEYLKNITYLKPTSKKGYYNYMKNALAYI